MITLTYLDDEMNKVTVNVIVIEKADVCPPYDKRIRTVEVYGGWWELWNIYGVVCGYFESDDSMK